MANLHQSFKDFNETIKLNSSHKESLRTSRNAVRKRIRAYFKDKEKGYTPKFHGQGSFMMNAIIEPLDGEFDIDDGIYLEVDSVPTESISTLHRWIYDAVDRHTKEKPEDKNPCVRLTYSGNYHIDLPLYYIQKNQSPYLAHKSKGWIQSDPREFIDWFNKKADDNGQLKRIVRYLKAWKDYRSGDLPCGLIFCILAAQNVVYDERDDIALFKTLEAIYSVLNSHFVCYRPTTPYGENLFSEYSETNKKYLLDRLTSFINSAEEAIDDETSSEKACKCWQRHLGKKRFSLSSSDTKALSFSASVTNLDGYGVSPQFEETEEFIENRYIVSPILYPLSIKCTVKQKGFRSWSLRELLRRNLPLLSGKELLFEIVKNECPLPYKIFWKVCNVGDEALKRDCIRGQIFEGKSSIFERTNFKGQHFVECYIIKNNVCVARDRIAVPIDNNSKKLEST